LLKGKKILTVCWKVINRKNTLLMKKSEKIRFMHKLIHRMCISLCLYIII